MPIIYLKHERHGNKVAIAEAEAVADEAKGWVRYTLGEPEIVASPDPESSEDVPEFLNALSVKRRGRPPKNAASTH